MRGTNAKKIVEVDLKQKGTSSGTPQTGGGRYGGRPRSSDDQFGGDESDRNIKFTTLFGLLATEIAVTMMTDQAGIEATCIGAFFFIIALIFVYRSFYGDANSWQDKSMAK